MHSYSIIIVNNIADLSIDFGLNHAFRGSYNEEIARISKSLQPVA